MQQLAPSPKFCGPAYGANDVKSIDQFPIYELGAALKQFQMTAKRVDATAFDQLVAVMDASLHLDRLIRGIEFEIGFCRQAAVDLRSALREMQKAFEGEGGKIVIPDEALPLWRLSMHLTAIDAFEHQLSAELKKIGTYLVPERGIFNTARLVDDADLHIHETLRSVVPDFARAEFRRSGRCLAFGLHSASGFHSARAVENMTRKYYEKFLGVPKKKDIGLGLMASHLGDMFSATAKATLLPLENTVRHLRDFTNFDRNPLIHHAVDIHEIDATTLFNSAAAVIVEMAKELKPDKQEPVNALVEFAASSQTSQGS